jgi:hypothetical protein
MVSNQRLKLGKRNAGKLVTVVTGDQPAGLTAPLRYRCQRGPPARVPLR